MIKKALNFVERIKNGYNNTTPIFSGKNDILTTSDIRLTMKIPDLDGYLKLNQKNNARFNELAKIIHKRHDVELSDELLKEVALNILFKKYTINEIENTLLDYYITAEGKDHEY